ncbi:tRNA pseudouridine synthase A [Candidatus Westeberhardia cardiocondylae]|uniref:tRNA pseudouridine synthase A n=1 Tax=Candidatus Westeberhardia cardiocondylae TaxID=1594731 RepID=A0A0H5BX72_9ENTR|nr:tRNA pseudouridine(38-40) synthase TruA [Candidatus Westeberhardia cardiocondylae]CEN32313.1 tRNA pseudouridine synthase A [Candidatus Westeberhardia cardiocondylae]
MKIALSIGYDGSKFFGWQRQKNLLSIQENIEYALSKIANEKIKTSCASRTDTGVHATSQIIHFNTNKILPINAWTLGVNSNLKKNINVNWAKPVQNNFHARFSAISRRYRYIIYNFPTRPSLFNNGLMHCKKKLNIQNMNFSAKYLLGEKNFVSFRSSKCQSKTSWRNIYLLQIKSINNYIIIDIKANSFLHHMVRNIVGSFIEIGKEKQTKHWIQELLKNKNRKLAGPTAPAKGLYLVEIKYPTKFNLPITPIGPLFLTE